MSDATYRDGEAQSPSQRTDSVDTEKIPPDHLGVLVAAVVMMVTGWFGVYWLVTTTLPRVGQRWLFFVALQIAITGTVLPFVRYINMRFTPLDRDLPPGGVFIRQSIWVGLYVVTAAWLQIPRVLTPPVAFFLALVFIVIEVFLRLRERQNERRYGD